MADFLRIFDPVRFPFPMNASPANGLPGSTFKRPWMQLENHPGNGCNLLKGFKIEDGE